MKVCIKNTQLVSKTMGSKIFFKNTNWTIEEIKYQIPRKLRNRFPNEQYSYVTLKKVN